MELKELAEWITAGPDREIKFKNCDKKRAIQIIIRDGCYSVDRFVSTVEIENAQFDALGYQIRDGIKRIENARAIQEVKQKCGLDELQRLSEELDLP